MGFANRISSGRFVKTAGFVTIAGAALAATFSAPAQEDRTGVSHPAPMVITSDSSDDSTQSPSPSVAKPSAAIPASVASPATSPVYGPYVPYRVTNAPPQANSTQISAFNPDASIVTAATAGQDQRRLLAGPAASAKPDEDAGIVTRVPLIPGEIAEGTIVKVKLAEDLSTASTQPGTKFTAEVSEPVMRDGSVVVPAGSILEGRVMWVRGGKRIGGAAALHLEPRNITLPDGMQYALRARVIDTSSWQNTKVDGEGTIMRSENKKRNAGVMSLTAGAGMAAGAIIAGPAGALVGAGVGAGVSTIVWLRQDRQAVLPKDLGLVFSLTEPMSITPATAALAPLHSPAATN